jgi:hypothetical protein
MYLSTSITATNDLKVICYLYITVHSSPGDSYASLRRLSAKKDQMRFGDNEHLAMCCMCEIEASVCASKCELRKGAYHSGHSHLQAGKESFIFSDGLFRF